MKKIYMIGLVAILMLSIIGIAQASFLSSIGDSIARLVGQKTETTVKTDSAKAAARLNQTRQPPVYHNASETVTN